MRGFAGEDVGDEVVPDAFDDVGGGGGGVEGVWESEYAAYLGGEE